MGVGGGTNGPQGNAGVLSPPGSRGPGHRVGFGPTLVQKQAAAKRERVALFGWKQSWVKGPKQGQNSLSTQSRVVTGPEAPDKQSYSRLIAQSGARTGVSKKD